MPNRTLEQFRRVASLTLALCVAAACGSSGEHTDTSTAAAGTAARPEQLRDGDVRIVTEEGNVDLALVGDTVSSGLSPTALAKAREGTDTAKVTGSGLGASIERMVKSSVQGAIATRVAFSVNDVREARYTNGRIEFDWIGERKQIFDQTKINKKPLLESFAPADAERFVAAVNARRAAVAQ